jgi:hypothetical protein
MQSLTEVVPHPVTTTLVATGTLLHSKGMGCTLLLNVMGELT